MPRISADRRAGGTDRGRRPVLLLILWATLGFACVTNSPEPDTGTDSPERRLSVKLASLVDDEDESSQLAQTAITYSRTLADEYRLTRPPLFHNVLVNVGIKERGLCWHWTEDLLARLRDLKLDRYDLYWGTAYRGQLFREHNSVIVTAKGSPLETGLILDPWRNSGELYWVSVEEDTYPWEKH